MIRMKDIPAVRRLCSWLFALMLGGLFHGCESPPSTSGKSEPPGVGGVFQSPEEAVEIAGGLIREHKWAELAAYYDLSGSDFSAGDLENGTFFHAPRTEGAEHPSGVSRYRHPFPPGYRLLETEPTERDDTVKVIMLLEIDQGIGVPQRSLAAFLMRRQADASGWKILPQSVGP